LARHTAEMLHSCNDNYLVNKELKGDVTEK
jgi:hypothetical protein